MAAIPIMNETNANNNHPLLEVRGLKTQFRLKGGRILRAVDGIDLSVKRGEIHGLVGESGCGKTVASLSLLKLINAPGSIEGGSIVWDGKDLISYNEKEMLQVRGKEMAMIFQNPQSSLNPVYSIGSQLVSVIRRHQKMTNEHARKEAIKLLRLVRIPDSESVLNNYPHQLSGGMCQRIMIAMALACKPKLLIADEPTASLDVTIQAQIMDLLLEIRDRFDMAMLLVSHDLGVIARMCDAISVMYLGRIVENASARDLYSSPLHPYTKALLKSVPVPDPNQRGKIAKIEGDIPSPTNIPTACRFSSRCPEVFKLCNEVDPVLYAVEGNDTHQVACLLHRNDDKEGTTKNWH